MSISLPPIVLDVIGSALRQIGADPTLPLRPEEVPTVADAVGARLQQDRRFQDVAAEVEHLTNQEPWFRSRVTWGALMSLVAAIGSGFGLALGPAEVEAAVTVLAAGGTMIGAFVALYGRWLAKRPIAY
jgi:hypothetical protein